MPLRDHFNPPVNRQRPWEVLHGMWPGTIVRQLDAVLPPGFAAGPTVSLGGGFEVDIGVAEDDEQPVSKARFAHDAEPDGGEGSVATATAVGTVAIPAATMTLNTDIPDQDDYEVSVYDDRCGTRLVAAIELVSPSNKDRPESRRSFVAKCSALLRQDVCVSIVDVVTIRNYSFYAELLESLGVADPNLSLAPPPTLYAVTLRRRRRAKKLLSFDAWHYPLAVGARLPKLPIWLETDHGLMLDLEPGYEETCRVLRIA